MDKYFKAYHPSRIPETLARFIPNNVTASSLRIWVRKGELVSFRHAADMTRLFKYKARFPDCKVTCQGLPDVNVQVLRIVERAINHDDPTWRKWVSRSRISQVRFQSGRDEKEVYLTAVVKERFTEPWMKVLTTNPPAEALEQFRRRFGLHDKPWKVSFSVDYS
jgi:hypothetical protein